MTTKHAILFFNSFTYDVQVDTSTFYIIIMVLHQSLFDKHFLLIVDSITNSTVCT